ncbi:MAG: glycosyltransferase [Candidatus Rokubacteria bacterium]|nr:glycosyltransferase [Candidatus Rokubacteria bacterium]
MPRVSVVMPARDAAAWIGAAVESVLGQTFDDLELIVVDDGSRDDSAAIAGRAGDARVRTVRQPARGTAAALNAGIAAARAPLIARMDADDIALPDRLALQVGFLDARPDVGVLGAGWRELTPDGHTVDVTPPATGDAGIRGMLARRNPLAHPTVVVRRTAGEAVGWYDERWPVAQDYDLWIRIARVTRFANLPSPLLVRRFTPGMTSVARDDLRLLVESRIRLAAVKRGDLPASAVIWALRARLVRLLPRAVRDAVRGRRNDGLGRLSRAARP